MCIRDRYLYEAVPFGKLPYAGKLGRRVPRRHIAVSYTHLDVYKRQALDGAPASRFLAELKTALESFTALLIGLSLIHI